MQATISCMHCGAAQAVTYEPDQGPQRRESRCEHCAKPVTIYISIYANGQGIVTQEIKRSA